MNLLDPQGPVAAANSTILVDSVFIMLAIVVPTIIAILAFAFWFRASNTTARFQNLGSDAPAMALKQLTQFVHQQAAVMAFADVFLILTVVFVAIAAGGLAMKRPAAPAAGAGGH